MSSLVADTESVDVVLDAIVARVEAEVFVVRVPSESNFSLSHSEGLHLGSPLLDSMFLSDATFSATRIRSVTASAGRKRGWALVDDTVEVDLCWDVTSGAMQDVTNSLLVWSRFTTPAGRREGLRVAQRRTARIGELLTDRSGHGPVGVSAGPINVVGQSGFPEAAVNPKAWPRRWNPRIVETRERFALWADGHVQFVVSTLSMLFTRQERRGS